MNDDEKIDEWLGLVRSLNEDNGIEMTEEEELVLATDLHNIAALYQDQDVQRIRHPHETAIEESQYYGKEEDADLQEEAN